MSTLDKYEYKIRSEEIRNLIAQGEYAEAAEIADMIDWRRVKSVMMLCTISDLYKINRRFEESKELLLLAYDRHPGGRTILYSLCELSIKMGEFVQAIEYYKEFVQVAPKDTGRYVLQYKLYVAQEVSLEERIEVLEELKKRDYREKWAYELAYLYHRVGLATRCVEECDELILWFGEGKYVTKAMELKMLHQPLTPEQQAKYEGRFEEYRQQQEESRHAAALPVDEDNPIDVMDAPTVEISGGELEDIQVKTLEMGECNTINLQEALADSMKDIWEGGNAMTSQAGAVPTWQAASSTGASTEGALAAEPSVNEASMDDTPSTEETPAEQPLEEATAEEPSIITEEYFNTPTEELPTPVFPHTEDMTEVALQLDEPAQPQAVAPAEIQVSAPAETLAEPMEAILAAVSSETPVDDTASQVMAQMRQDAVRAEQPAMEEQTPEAQEAQKQDGQASEEPVQEVTAQAEQAQQQEPAKEEHPVLKRPGVFDKYLGMEYDGQMSFVVPETEKVEKQITGQLNIEDILAEWERMKAESEKECAEEVRQLVLQHTGSILIDFDQAVKDGLLEKLEKEEGITDPVAEEERVLEELEEEEEEQEETLENLQEEAGADMTDAEVMDTEEADAEEIREDMAAAEAADAEEAAVEADAIREETAEEPEEELTAAGTEEPGAEDIEEPGAEAVEEPGAETIEESEEEPEAEPEEQSADALEEQASEEKTAEQTKRPEDKSRALTREEKELYASFIQSRETKEQLVNAIDSISLAPYTGNVIITGEEGMDTLSLAKNMMREVQMTDSNFSGKIARITGNAMNQQDIDKVFDKLSNGALIIEKAGKLTPETGEKLYKALQKENAGIILILEGTKKTIEKLLEKVPSLKECFNARIDVEAMDNDSLVAFGKKYAKEQEYSIDEMGLLALHTAIANNQTLDHAVTLMEVKEMVDDAIYHANRKNIAHFFDVLFAKRYDEEDRIILKEKDFL